MSEQPKILTFTSFTENSINKADWMIKLPLRATVITRRQIKPTDKCVCGKEFTLHEQHFGHRICNLSFKRIPSLFFPAKYAIGKRTYIQKKKFGGALCECGRTKLALDENRWFVHGTSAHCFKPVQYEITSGMWHKDWMKNYVSIAFGENELKREAKYEGFKTWEGLCNAFKENESKWGKLEDSWRVELKKV